MEQVLESAEMGKIHNKGASFLGEKSGPLTMHFQHSGAKIRVFEQTQTSLTLAFLFSDSTYILYLLKLFLLANSHEPLVVSVSVLNHVVCKKLG